jgi:hypothetical protein
MFGIKGERWSDKGAAAPKVQRLEQEAAGAWIFPLQADTPRGAVVSRTQGAQYFASSRREISNACPVPPEGGAGEVQDGGASRRNARRRREEKGDVGLSKLETEYSY